MQYFKGKKVLVYGMGDSGYFASKLLFENEACVGIFDDDKEHKNLFCFDEDPLSGDYDLVVISPGIKIIGNTLIESFRQKNIPVISELDLGFNFLKGKLIAITGTNGKTTTTKLLGEIFKQAGHETFVCGNIGLPICAISKKTNKHSVTICEVSNFQLESTKVFNPDVACILNLQQDHIDRHGNFAEYVRVKNKITQNFGKSNVLFYNLDDDNCGLVNLSKKAIGFSAVEQKGGGYVKDGEIYFNKTKIMDESEVPLRGEKNLQNVVCAISVASFLKIKPEVIRQAIKNFSPPKHRLEFVGRFNGAQFYDDSKATNVPSVVMAVESLNEKNLILMLGGRNKDCSYEQLFNKKFDIKKVVCFGEAGELINSIARGFGYKTECYETMKQAAKEVVQNAENGDVVLLSPGGSSFDEFCSYAERGQIFKEIVKRESEKVSD